MIDGRAIGEAVVGMIVGAFLAGMALGVMLTAGLPKLWQWLKPLIHSWTA
jgi:hypothetical protein